MMGHQIHTTEASTSTYEKIANKLSVNLQQGLGAVEAECRRQTHGYNEFHTNKGHSMFRKYIEQFREPMIFLLLCSAVISLFMEQIDDAVSITVAIFIVVSVAFIQGYRSEKAIEALRDLMPPKCNCIRDGVMQVFYARDLVPGDIVVLDIGDRIAADLRLFETVDLAIDESSLTGEAEPVVKTARALSNVIVMKTSDSDVEDVTGEFNASPLKSHHTVVSNMAYMGTLVRCGSGRGIVTATGSSTEFGEVFQMMQMEEAPRTPLQKSMDHLSKQLTFYSFIIIGSIVLIGLWQKRKLLEMFTIAVSLAVAAIPEGLPIVVTVTLAIGQMRMAKRNAVVKKLPAVETLGCVNVVCSDKTGTLTQNEMTVMKAVTCDGVHVTVGGIGYNVRGDVVCDKTQTIVTTESHPSIRILAEIGSVCNNAYLFNGVLRGKPTEGALLCFAAKLKLPDARQNYTRLEEWPFNSDTKKMTVKCMTKNMQNNGPPEEWFFVKGAFECVISNCTHYWTVDGPLKFDAVTYKAMEKKAHNLGSEGLRVLCMAYGSTIPGKEMICCGLVGILDPPRVGVESCIETLSLNGVRVLMITGDAMDTAIAIGSRLGLYRPSEACWSGSDIERMSISTMSKSIHSVSIFYRTASRHKVKIVKALQLRQMTVAMTGDGVNDAVALKASDIGIAMGCGGTDVCKEAADLVLVDDQFSSILAAMDEGKAIFYNIRNFVRFQLSTSIAALTLIALSTVCRLPNPLNAMQILWINILMDGPPAQSLGMEPVDEDVIQLPPRPAKEPILTRNIILSVLISASVIVAGTMWVNRNEMEDDRTVTPRGTTMTFTCFVFFDMFNALSSRSQDKSIFSIGFTTNKTFLIAVGLSLLGQFLVIYFPPLQSVFHTEALYFTDILLLTALTSSIFWIFELKKCLQSSTSWIGDKAVWLHDVHSKVFNATVNLKPSLRSRYHYDNVV